MKKSILTLLPALGLAAGIIGGCGGQGETGKPESAPGSGAAVNLNGAGATFPYPLYSKWFARYSQDKDLKINYQSVGSGAGIKQVREGTVDFGASDAPMKPKEVEQMPTPVAQLPTVAGAVVMIYNLPEVNNLKLTGPVLADMYLGNIKRWNDPRIAEVNPGAPLPDRAIVSVYRSDGSGTTSIFTTYLSHVSPEWESAIGSGKSVEWPIGIGGRGSDGVSSSVKNIPGSLGYVELAYAKQSGLPHAAIQNKAGRFVTASPESTTAAAEASYAALRKEITAPISNAGGEKSYPIAAFTYLLVKKQAKSPDKGTALKGFLKWAMTSGQKDAAGLDYAPLPPSVVALNEKIIAELK